MSELSINELESKTSAQPVIERIKLEPIRRDLTVRDARALTPRMIRVTLGGEELAGFVSPSPDDHIKLFFPTLDGERVNRDFTPRRFDAEALTLCVDFALHDGGVGSTWAQQAKPGDHLQIGGPRGSTVVSAPGFWWLLIGDETALPAIGRRVEEMAPGTRVLTLTGVTSREEEQEFKTNSDLTALWVHRPDSQAADPVPFLKAIHELKLPAGPGFIWIAAEAEVARAVRAYFTDTLNHPPAWLKASAYWSQKPDAHEQA